ncbi:hypothetical protein AWZ03_011507 [Drosophila navojoa]|uniref:Trichohyalin-plectin-homology domain-containing protein n=1 Tax=Drosophila navojoa TaxID=7232 RepID=A0A484B0A7_DRONA|nr:polyamine-modulated factor 1-binding protein 1 [Drosophila navojoa]TDG42074.1 hypothetical protein AWZ03_011507 [Drosophila navojoa]
MAEGLRRGRRRRIEPARIQYGAWDNPGVSLFATVPQEPVGDMLRLLKPLPREGRDRALEMEASPLILAPTSTTSRLFREVKYQVQQIADDRNRNYHPIQERERQSALIAGKLAKRNNREFAEVMRSKQLQINSQRVRELQIEIERAKTTLSVVSKRNENMRNKGKERVEERREALEDRELVRKEKEAEQQALRDKTLAYSQQLVAQIRKLQAERAEKEMADMEEGRLKRYNDEQAHANDVKEGIESKFRKRAELKKMLDDFSALQRSLREANPVPPDKLNVILMEAVGPVTKCFMRQAIQQKLDLLERRRLISDGLSAKLAEIRGKKEAHDKMLGDILVSERQVREKQKARQEVLDRHNQKLQVAKDLIEQHEEKEFFREKNELLFSTIPTDATSFMQRQYQQTLAKEAARREINKMGTAASAAEIAHNARLRALAVEEDRMLKQAILDMEADTERRVDEERMRILRAQPREIIDELRPCKLSPFERMTFNLSSCAKDGDTHTH